MSAAVAVIIRKERDIVNMYRSAGATRPSAARDPNELGVHPQLAFDRLVRRAVLREASPGLYYLDEPSWEALRRVRRRVASAMLVAVVLVGLFAFLAQRVATR